MVLQVVIASALLVITFWIWRLSFTLIQLLQVFKDISSDLYDISYDIQEMSK